MNITCLFHLDFTGTINFEKTTDVHSRQKLIFGLIWSLKSFSQMLSVKPLQNFRNYSTSKYKLHIYELPTGLKLILITTPSKPDQLEKLQQLFQQLYVPLVSRNMFCQPNSKIHCKVFTEKVTEFLVNT
ncbi:trafficking protein particle complex subunit 1-like [Stylonychia lemnae]|uniref:Trafficking protein particle complex subunit n=1 Tax=Stylonychia lemnae TaxID=5949 RepID=A0A078AB07_STYLE|nr:trafficking protein particle complex subunit 1-like [Stylonychia lemnae]|eukprot:CDW79051.1 trafficking protein particle complex subunit 1-like [Stylonychia lemnae]